MALLKSYSCVKCGGVLNFDEDQEVFGCPFCGGEFAFTDFHRGDLLRQARRCLENGSYSTALDKFRSILKRNPKDFEALQGTILAQAHLSAVNRLCRIEYLENIDFKEAIQATKDGKEALPEESDYFDLLLHMFELANDYHKKSDETDESIQAKNKKFKDMGYRLLALEEQEQAAFEAYKNIVFFVITRIFLFVVAITVSLDVGWVAAIFIGIFVLIGILMKLGYSIEKKHLEAAISRDMKDQFDKEDAAYDNMLDIRNEYMKTYIRLKRIVPNPKAYEKPLPPEKKEPSEATDPFISIEKTVVCSKCGGQLILDKEKKLYECRSCGVAYGVSLFFDDPLKKAVKALKDNDFAEAEQRFSTVLMLEPHCVDALLGRVLCTGKWKTLNDIILTDKLISDVRMKALKERAAEAVSHALEQDKPVFEELEKLIGILCEHSAAVQEYKVYNKRLEYISKNRITFLKNSEAFTPLDEQSDLINWRRQALYRAHTAKDEFEELKKQLIRDNVMRIKRNSEAEKND